MKRFSSQAWSPLSSLGAGRQRRKPGLAVPGQPGPEPPAGLRRWRVPEPEDGAGGGQPAGAAAQHQPRRAEPAEDHAPVRSEREHQLRVPGRWRGLGPGLDVRRRPGRARVHGREREPARLRRRRHPRLPRGHLQPLARPATSASSASAAPRPPTFTWNGKSLVEPEIASDTCGAPSAPPARPPSSPTAAWAPSPAGRWGRPRGSTPTTPTIEFTDNGLYARIPNLLEPADPAQRRARARVTWSSSTPTTTATPPPSRWCRWPTSPPP